MKKRLLKILAVGLIVCLYLEYEQIAIREIWKSLIVDHKESTSSSEFDRLNILH